MISNLTLRFDKQERYYLGELNNKYTLLKI